MSNCVFQSAHNYTERQVTISDYGMHLMLASLNLQGRPKVVSSSKSFRDIMVDIFHK